MVDLLIRDPMSVAMKTQCLAIVTNLRESHTDSG